MSYVQGVLIPVAHDKKDAYLDMARKAALIFKEYGALRIVECWGDAIPDGKVTDFKQAVKATGDETVVFSWVEWPDKATYEAAAQKMESDSRWQAMGDMPFDGMRMMWAGFEPILDT